MNNTENRAPDSKPIEVTIPWTHPWLTLPEHDQVDNSKQTKKCRNIFKSRNHRNTHHAWAYLSPCPVSLQFIFTAHPIVQAGQHPDVGHSTVEVQEQDPSLRRQFCLRSPTSSTYLLTPLSTSAHVCWMKISPPRAVYSTEHNPHPPSVQLWHQDIVMIQPIHCYIQWSFPVAYFQGFVLNLPPKHISLTGHHHYYYYLLFRLQL